MLPRYHASKDGFLQAPDQWNEAVCNKLFSKKDHEEIMPVHTNIMRASGLFNGDFVLVDRSIQAKKEDVVVVRYNTGIVIRKLKRLSKGWHLVADDPREELLPLNNTATFELLGVVTDKIIV